MEFINLLLVFCLFYNEPFICYQTELNFTSGFIENGFVPNFADKKYPNEIKLWYGEKTVEDGISQLSGYMDTLSQNEGWPVIFDRSLDKSWDEKIY